MWKATTIFGYTSREERHAGWSETWYRDGTQEDVLAAMNAYNKKRAVILPGSCSILGVRVQQVGGRGFFFKDPVPGVQAGANVQDIPQMALYCEVKAADRDNLKRFTFRGIPDGWVIGGDWQPPNPGVGTPQQVINEASNQQLAFRCVDLTAPIAAVANISDTGNVTLLANLTVAVNDPVAMLRVKNTLGKAITGIFYVETVTDAQHFKLRNWTGGTVNQSGRVRKLVYRYPQINKTTFKILNAGPRKVGRPFAVYRGRRRRTR